MQTAVFKSTNMGIRFFLFFLKDLSGFMATRGPLTRRLVELILSIPVDKIGINVLIDTNKIY